MCDKISDRLSRRTGQYFVHVKQKPSTLKRKRRIEKKKIEWGSFGKRKGDQWEREKRGEWG
jgi:hypothetical protein